MQGLLIVFAAFDELWAGIHSLKIYVQMVIQYLCNLFEPYWFNLEF